MNPNDNQAQSAKVHNPLEVMQPGEQMVCEIRRHPIGLISIYVVTGLVLAAVLSAAILVPYYATFLTDQQKNGIFLAAALIIVITLIFTYISVYVYQANRWIVTTDSVTQITQNNLFGRDVSQLSLANFEDTSVDQDSFWQALFGYGDLIVESAGEHGNFTFHYCPNPYDYARKIIAAHEAFIAHRPDEMVVANRPLAAVTSFNQPGGIDPTQFPSSNNTETPASPTPPSAPTAV